MIPYNKIDWAHTPKSKIEEPQRKPVMRNIRKMRKMLNFKCF
jgi:hypothetical protein